eukprot:3371657-Amphidinium_carterae.1
MQTRNYDATDKPMWSDNNRVIGPKVRQFLTRNFCKQRHHARQLNYEEHVVMTTRTRSLTRLTTVWW